MKKLLSALLTIAAALILPGCTMVTDDIQDCPKGLYVRFVYDYNIQRADMFKDHVGHVTLYVYDEEGNLVTQRSVSNQGKNEPLAVYGYSMHFEPSELAPGKYRLVAIGMQRDWDEAIADKGAKMRRPDSHSHYSELRLSLDHNEQPHPETGHHAVDHQYVPLDTLWHTLKVSSYEPMDGTIVPALHKTTKPFSIYPLEEQFVEVRTDRATYATVSLIRDTKHINITLRQLDDKADIHADEYEVTIADDNATLDHDNSIVSGHLLGYSPYASWTSRFDSSGVTIESGDIAAALRDNPAARPSRAGSESTDEDPDTQRTAHFNLMTNRIIHYDGTPENNARLRIVNKQTKAVVADINLASMLQQGRIAWAINNYSAQEYLDREYDYHLQMFLRGDKWAYCDIVVNVLGWSHRTQNAIL